MNLVLAGTSSTDSGQAEIKQATNVSVRTCSGRYVDYANSYPLADTTVLYYWRKTYWRKLAS